MALGAERRNVLLMILRQGAWQIAAGLALGLGLAALLSRGLGLLLFGVRPWDPPVFVGRGAGAGGGRHARLVHPGPAGHAHRAGGRAATRLRTPPSTVLLTILSAAIVVTLLTSAAIVLGWGGRRVEGAMPLSLPGFMALLFTSGLDVGLIMLPLTEFPLYAREPVYAFANPLAIAFGSWGFLVWGFYFLTTFYFLAVEPRLRLFEIPAVKVVNNVVIVGTCAFTAHLLLRNLPFYVPAIGDAVPYLVVAGTVLLAVLTSTHIRYIRVLSVGSMWLFAALVAAMWLQSGMGVRGLAASAADIGPYFTQLPRFVLPMSDYHAFYLFWWFSWSIMIGQFVARFVGRMRTWQLAAALLVMPSIPIGAWFSVLYFYFRQQARGAAGARRRRWWSSAWSSSSTRSTR